MTFAKFISKSPCGVETVLFAAAHVLFPTAEPAIDPVVIAATAAAMMATRTDNVNSVPVDAAA